MKIVLQNKMIIIRTGFKTMSLPWMSEYLTIEDQQILFLPKAVLIFNSHHLFDVKERFLKALAHFYATTEDHDEGFFLKALLKYAKYPVRIELESMEEIRTVSVDLQACDATRVIATLAQPNCWIKSFLRSQMSRYVSEETDTTIEFDVSQMKAKSRLEKILGKRHVLHFMIQYRYETRFMQRLYADYAGFDEEEDTHEQVDEMLHYFTILECPVGASQDALKKSYRKLVKVYHPDRVHCESEEMVNHYTQKFQLLQEAYTALRIVS